MALLGHAALAMWWDIAPALRTEFQDWHSHEHFQERLALPGFNRATRWASLEGEGFFVLYELESHDVLASPGYLVRLNAPTPWSVKLMPHHRNMVRSQCRVEESRGSGIGGVALTLRFTPRTGHEQALRGQVQQWITALPPQAGVMGAHFLRTDPPAIATTNEQQLRGNADTQAAWVLLVTGYRESDLQALRQGLLSTESLQRAGAQEDVQAGLFRLDASMLAADGI